jgi:WD40 repeat protein
MKREWLLQRSGSLALLAVDSFKEEGADDLAFSADGSLLFVGTTTGDDIQAYDTSTWTMTSTLLHQGTVLDFAVASHSPLLALGTLLVEGPADQLFHNVATRVIQWDYENNVLFPPVNCPTRERYLEDMAFSPDGHLLAVVGKESVVSILGVEP